MKYLFLALVFASCASYHHESLTPFSPSQGMKFSELENKMGKPEKCQEFGSSKYCQWKATYYHFDNDVLESKWEFKGEGVTYDLSIETMSADSKVSKNANIVPGRKSLNPNGIEWRRYFPLLKAAFETNSYVVTNTLKDSAQFVKANFGIRTGEKEGSRRFLTLTSYESAEKLKSKKEIEIWKVNVVSVGSGKDLSKVFPVLVYGAYDFIGTPSNENINVSVQENSLNFQAFKHYFKVK